MIWCVEDDDSIREIEVYALQSVGLQARGFETAQECLDALEDEMPELIILDVMLPEMSGEALLIHLREHAIFSHIPIIMATAKGTEFDKVKLLDLGADDYLVKPFGMMEMISRVKAVLRRIQTPRHVDQNIVRIGEKIQVYLHERKVYVDQRVVNVTYKEFEILVLLLSKQGVVFTRDQLYHIVWGQDYVGETRTVDMHIRTLRQKLGEYGHYIETVRNVGYRLEVPQ